jgi:hypothetical protein
MGEMETNRLEKAGPVKKANVATKTAKGTEGVAAACANAPTESPNRSQNVGGETNAKATSGD